MRDINYIAQCCDVAKIITAFILIVAKLFAIRRRQNQNSLRNLYFGEYLQVFSFFIVFSTHFAVSYEGLGQ